jgi:hypothetical protein
MFNCFSDIVYSNALYSLYAEIDQTLWLLRSQQLFSRQVLTRNTQTVAMGLSGNITPVVETDSILRNQAFRGFESRGRARVSQPGGSSLISVPQQCEGVSMLRATENPVFSARGESPRLQTRGKLTFRSSIT